MVVVEGLAVSYERGTPVRPPGKRESKRPWHEACPLNQLGGKADPDYLIAKKEVALPHQRRERTPPLEASDPRLI